MIHGSLNRIANSKNEFQGKYKKVLCVCSAGLLRSPTCSLILSQEPFNYNTRAAGLSTEFALIMVDDVLLIWADEIVCMELKQADELRGMLKELGLDKPVICLGIADSFCYRDPHLMEIIKNKYQNLMDNGV